MAVKIFMKIHPVFFQQSRQQNLKVQILANFTILGYVISLKVNQISWKSDQVMGPPGEELSKFLWKSIQ